MIKRRGFFLLPAALAGCAAPQVASLDDLPGWNEDRLAEAVHAPSEAAARDWLRQRFRARLLPRLRFTGYFELTVAGSRSQGGRFQVPLLRQPPDAASFDRAQILSGALAGRGLEIAWLASPGDLFFVQLQGSGRVVLAEGGVVRVTSAGANGRAPVPTETLFADAGDLSIPGLRAWVGASPRRAARLASDPSYVFFRESPAGPRGASGAPLVPMRSLAVDPAMVPLGSFVWIDVSPLRRLMFAQDTGATIRGASADVFVGAGPQAEDFGGHLNAEGWAWLLA